METSCRNLVKENQAFQGDSVSCETVSNPGNEQTHINDLPDSIFLHIFSYLRFSVLGNVAQVCHRWRQIAKDDLLWKDVFLRYYKLPQATTMSPRGELWKSEFKRLYYYTPCVLSEERKEHRDEVLHVSFSHDGTMFATCSKDGFFKVWKNTHPSQLLFERDMMSLFSWKYTQFSQFNETDTCLLVSGVYFGSLTTSGEIAVFDLQGDFRMQCRVNNKPYDVFGAWYDNDHLLSGTLYCTGNFTSVSAVWLSKASQEVESEMESVSMVLYRFENVNSSSIRLLHVAEVETDQGDEEANGVCTVSPPSEKSHTSGTRRIPGRTCPSNTIPSEMSKLLQKNLAEDEFDISDEDESEYEIEPNDVDRMNPEYCRRKKHHMVNRLDHEFREFSRSFFNSHRNVLYRCDLDERPVVNSSVPDSSVPLPSTEDKQCHPHCEASSQFHQDEIFVLECEEEMDRSSTHKDEQNSSCVNRCSDKEESLCCGVQSQSVGGAVEHSLLDFETGNCIHDTHHEKRCSSTSAHLSADHNSNNQEFCTEHNFEADVESDCTSNCEMGKVNKDMMDKLTDDVNSSETGGLIDNATQTEEVPSRTSSFQSLSHMSHASSLSNEFCKSQREKLLIYTWGSETYIPHKIGIKRMKPSDFCKGARQASVLLPDVMENLHNMSGDRRDVPDVSIDMHGHIVGLSLSPDQRYLYVNCRSWPKNCIITDPQEALPLAQEVEIFTIDLRTFQFTGPVLRSHKAYTDSDKCFFLNLDVSDDFVVSGAEDRRGYLWERHYGIPLYHFYHRDVVNSVALNPRDPEIAVSASDDHTFKVWMSRRKMKKYQRRGIQLGHLTHRQSPVENV